MSHVPMSNIKHVPFTPQSLRREGEEPEVEFYLRVPSWEDRDMVGLRLYSMNVKEVTGDNIQSLMLSEAFNIWPEAEADDNARFLEGFWQRQRQHLLEMEGWAEQETIRRIEEAESGLAFEATDPPAETTTTRERARAALLNQEIIDRSARVRDKLVEQQMYTVRFNIAIARMHIVGWRGIEATAVFEGDLLSKDTVEQIRSDLMEKEGTGAAWKELCAHIESLFALPTSAEKNSSSPPGNSSPPGGSTRLNTETATAPAGASTSPEATAGKSRSRTGSTRAGGSPKTTATSSGSTRGSAPGRKKPGRTAAK